MVCGRVDATDAKDQGSNPAISNFHRVLFSLNRTLEGRSVDQVVIVLTFYSKDLSLNPAKVLLC